MLGKFTDNNKNWKVEDYKGEIEAYLMESNSAQTFAIMNKAHVDANFDTEWRLRFKGNLSLGGAYKADEILQAVGGSRVFYSDDLNEMFAKVEEIKTVAIKIRK